MDDETIGAIRLSIEAIGTGVADVRAENAHLRKRLEAVERKLELIAARLDRADRRD